MLDAELLLVAGYDVFTLCTTDDLPEREIQEGDRIALRPKDAKYTGGVVIERARDQGTVTIQLDNKNAIFKTCKLDTNHVRHVYRLNQRTRIGPDHVGRVLVVGETHDFRAAARLQIFPDDVVAEIGSSYGQTSSLLGRYVKKSIGFDCSKECVEEARRRHPSLDFVEADCFREPELVKEQSAGCNVVFIDIGGCRDIPDQVQMLEWVMANLRPEMIIIKSRKLFGDLRAYGLTRGVHGGLAATPGMREWLLQNKKKYACDECKRPSRGGRRKRKGEE